MHHLTGNILKHAWRSLQYLQYYGTAVLFHVIYRTVNINKLHWNLSAPYKTLLGMGITVKNLLSVLFFLVFILQPLHVSSSLILTGYKIVRR